MRAHLFGCHDWTSRGLDLSRRRSRVRISNPRRPTRQGPFYDPHAYPPLMQWCVVEIPPFFCMPQLHYGWCTFSWRFEQACALTLVTFWAWSCDAASWLSGMNCAGGGSTSWRAHPPLPWMATNQGKYWRLWMASDQKYGPSRKCSDHLLEPGQSIGE